MPTQLDGNMPKVGMGMTNRTSAMAPMAPMARLDVEEPFTSMNGMNTASYQEGYQSGNMGGTWGMMNQPSVSGFHSEFEGRESAAGGGIYDGIALPDHILRQYYTQVRNTLIFSVLCFLLV